MQNPDFSEIVTLICKEDPRFDRKAYDFVRLGLDQTVKDLRKKDPAAGTQNPQIARARGLGPIRLEMSATFRCRALETCRKGEA